MVLCDTSCVYSFNSTEYVLVRFEDSISFSDEWKYQFVSVDQSEVIWRYRKYLGEQKVSEAYDQVHISLTNKNNYKINYI